MQCGYKAFYQGKSVEVYAETSYQAQQLAAAKLKVPEKKRYLITVVLCEKGGKPVVHTFA